MNATSLKGFQECFQQQYLCSQERNEDVSDGIYGMRLCVTHDIYKGYPLRNIYLHILILFLKCTKLCFTYFFNKFFKENYREEQTFLYETSKYTKKCDLFKNLLEMFSKTVFSLDRNTYMQKRGILIRLCETHDHNKFNSLRNIDQHI